MKSVIKITGMYGSNSMFNNIPEGWTIFGYLTNGLPLYSINFNFNFFTKDEIINKIKIENRKRKLNIINENKTSNSNEKRS